MGLLLLLWWCMERLLWRVECRLWWCGVLLCLRFLGLLLQTGQSSEDGVEVQVGRQSGIRSHTE